VYADSLLRCMEQVSFMHSERLLLYSFRLGM
jgi:hypothetical protein